MKSRIAQKLKLRHHPVVTLFADDKPEGALQFKAGTRGCVVSLVTAAAEGKVAAFDRETTPCPGGRSGLCFGSDWGSFRGGFEYFLSTGRGEGYPEGEGYVKTPELALGFMAGMPKTVLPQRYRIYLPLEMVDPDRDDPKLVTFYATADQLSALVVLANYGRDGSENVTIPFGAGCQTICILPLQEADKKYPRAMVGMVDISARPRVDADILAFTVPFKMFQEMEANVPGSFLERSAWKKVVERIPNPSAPTS